LEVLQGALDLLKNKRIKTIVFEHSKILLEKNNRPIDQVIRFLYENDYTVYKISGEVVKIEDAKNLVQEDLLAC